MAGNSSLNAAAHDKNDEFYTRLTDIEKELRHYRKHFCGVKSALQLRRPVREQLLQVFRTKLQPPWAEEADCDVLCDITYHVPAALVIRRAGWRG